MPKIVIRRGGGEVIEVSDLSLSEVKELLGMDRRQALPSVPAAPPSGGEAAPTTERLPDYPMFRKLLSPTARKFFEVLSRFPGGVNSEVLASEMGLKNANQVGGAAGGGIVKLARRFSIKVQDLYTTHIGFENGVRVRVYKPGKDISKI